ncbi:MAG TPA: hypothetical protein VGU25_06205 [Acidobacteriaceae bacterium]|nr:hypothetical protein [Acidobacteriaceae bacterium]
MGPCARRSQISPLAGALLCGVTFCATPALFAQVFTVGMKTATADVTTEFHPTRVELPTGPLDVKGRQELIRDLEAEQGFAHRELPLGAGMQLIANGKMSPSDEEYKRMLYEKGQSAAAGDRVEITNLEFRGDRIIIDFNGGPYAKHRFLSHISLNNMPLAQQGPLATGCRVTLIFEGGVPEVTAAEVKALLDPVVDFRAKSSAEAYADTLPPKVREAVAAHEILVGMNHRMVLASMGEPKTKEREHTSTDDPDSPIYEEWIYGDPPRPTQFVRFKNGKVVRLEIAAIGKPIEVHDKNEIGGEPEPTLQARTIVNGDPQITADGDRNGAAAPTLRKPGEVLDTAQNVPGMGKVKMPVDQAPAQTPSQQTSAQPAQTSAQPQSTPAQPAPASPQDPSKTQQLASTR